MTRREAEAWLLANGSDRADGYHTGCGAVWWSEVFTASLHDNYVLALMRLEVGYATTGVWLPAGAWREVGRDA